MPKGAMLICCHCLARFDVVFQRKKINRDQTTKTPDLGYAAEPLLTVYCRRDVFVRTARKTRTLNEQRTAAAAAAAVSFSYVTYQHTHTNTHTHSLTEHAALSAALWYVLLVTMSVLPFHFTLTHTRTSAKPRVPRQT